MFCANRNANWYAMTVQNLKDWKDSRDVTLIFDTFLKKLDNYCIRVSNAFNKNVNLLLYKLNNAPKIQYIHTIVSSSQFQQIIGPNPDSYSTNNERQSYIIIRTSLTLSGKFSSYAHMRHRHDVLWGLYSK